MLGTVMTDERNDALRAHAQRIADMSSVEIRRGPAGKPWERLRDLIPDTLREIWRCDDGSIDERVFIALGLGQGALEYVTTIDPQTPLAFRLSGQYRQMGGWQLTAYGRGQYLRLLLAGLWPRDR